MVLDFLSELLNEKEPVPNKFTIEMGKKIRNAREESGFSQVELAKKIFIRRATLSDIENGKFEVSAIMLARLALNLEKPIPYFFPEWTLRDIQKEELDPLEQELIIHFKKIFGNDLQKAAIQQIKALSEFDPTKILLESIDFAKNDYEIEQDFRKFMENRKKRK